jgi:hypothetical protein
MAFPSPAITRKKICKTLINSILHKKSASERKAQMPILKVIIREI